VCCDFGFCFVDMFFECQTAIKGNAEICWMGTVLKLFSIPRDVKVFVGMPVFEMKGTSLGFGWVCPQVVGLIVFIQLIKRIR